MLQALSGVQVGVGSPQLPGEDGGANLLQERGQAQQWDREIQVPRAGFAKCVQSALRLSQVLEHANHRNDSPLGGLDGLLEGAEITAPNAVFLQALRP